MRNKSNVIGMYHDWSVSHETNMVTLDEEAFLGVIEHLKEEFGDYADPMLYRWNHQEQDD
ncbi:hypothetical protein TI04_04270 [Achromatium sp. WMS2]|nr:hypothetical protein TI04_04270 [Achromatium sp. WMS2]